jgi:hypothetical protein
MPPLPAGPITPVMNGADALAAPATSQPSRPNGGTVSYTAPCEEFLPSRLAFLSTVTSGNDMIDGTNSSLGVPRHVVSQVLNGMMGGTGQLCPVTAKMSFDSHHVVSHVVVTAIMSSGCVDATAEVRVRARSHSEPLPCLPGHMRQASAPPCGELTGSPPGRG